MRFVPYVKKNYDYGMLVFLLTFNLITVSSYRIDTVIKIAHQRLLTIAGICLFMSLLVFPIWSGDDLHMSTVTKFQGLSRSIEGTYLLHKNKNKLNMQPNQLYIFVIFILYIACIKKYFEEKEKDKEDSDSESDDDDVIYKGYKTVLDSKSSDEALVSHLKVKSLLEIRLNS